MMFKPGTYLMIDDESGFRHFADEMIQRWDGAWVHQSNNEYRNPQEFVRAKSDPYPLEVIRPEGKLAAACASYYDYYVPGTTIRTPDGPATHLFSGIGKMEIGCSFVVR